MAEPPKLPSGVAAVDLPVWQSAFVLADNVRFTRTPESEIAKRRQPSVPEPEPKARASDPTLRHTAAPVVKEPIPASTPAVAGRRAIAPSTMPVGPARRDAVVASAHVAQSVPVSAAEPIVAVAPPASVAEPTPQVSEVPATTTTVEPNTPVGPEPRLSNVSDDVFWAALEFGGVVDLAETPNAPVQDIAAPPRPVLSFYRVLEWRRPGRPAEIIRFSPPAETPASPAQVVPTGPTEAVVVPVATVLRTAVAAIKTARIETPRSNVPTLAQSRSPAVPVSSPEPVREVPSLAPEQVKAHKPVVTERVVEASQVLIAEATVAPVAPQAEEAPLEASRLTVVLPASVQPERPLAPLTRGAHARRASLFHPDYEYPSTEFLQVPDVREEIAFTQEQLEQNAGLLESVLEDFGVKGEIIHVRPGPVVTLYEFEPAPGVKSSRVIGLADDIARSMSALSARVAVVPGRNVIGIELPNATRETVYFREMIESEDYESTKYKLALCLGKTIGGEPVIAELAKMPHLLVAGTTGSGKSVAVNTMILSLLYRLRPDECRLIMVDPKMLELSIYDGIPHLLTPVVTDPKKAVMALKWAVREMEDRYKKMSRLGVRNIDGFNSRVRAAKERGETIICTVQSGFDRDTGEATYEQEEMDLTPMPYIVVIVDEMADLMMVAGKDIEGAIQRLAQMARAAGIHLIMATQRPSVDVITGTIKANFPTRISFQVTSKIDSRTILGEQGAEQLLGQGDMLHMIGGGRIARVHGAFVSDEEVERIVAHLKTQGRPDYLNTVTAAEDEEDEPVPADSGAVFDKGNVAAEDGNELYEQAVKVVMRDKKCSTSYIQRRLQIGYNRAASLVERMEKEGLVGPANHVGKREIISADND
ncbi:DNA translocase FtsK [Rhizobiaceae bacterium n13]|uniref:DNA translocase FtsK n=1 Tax=Ferirhizobium litorale TaxID=2927786 RepID=A0AAE3QBS7_9HYPH|nr:DNA translocase FtsK [Fererhizobium litorale]MDI7861712.1 DNA translocase FtsK [Fererhizobium litorale]MDI7921946.1 DNA translocase FtsK [Fererhizobium litorale]